MATRRQYNRMLVGLILVTLVSCTQAHRREIDSRLRERFRITVPNDANLDSAVRAAVIRHVPLGAQDSAIYAYLEMNGFHNARDSPARERAYYTPRGASLQIEATLEDYREHWYSPIDYCDYPVSLIFEFNERVRLSNVRVVRHGYCI